MVASATNGNVILSGAGATFPSPLYQKWIETYQKESKIRISYQGVGSGEGIKLLYNREVDFGATDVFLSEQEMRRSPAEIIHIPTCIGAVAIIYNLPGNPELRFTPDIIVDILLGRITKWDDDRIARVNPNVVLSKLDITVVHRSEKSGTTFLLTDYLSNVSRSWKNNVGAGMLVRWPKGLGVEGNSGMADTIKRIQGSIGYVSLNFAKKNQLPVAAVRNRSGLYIYPTEESLSLAATVEHPSDFRTLITDSPVQKGYPISAFTYLIFYKEQAYSRRTREKALAMSNFLWWCVHEGQAYNEPLFYAPLPRETVTKAEKIIRSMLYKGQPLF